MLYGILSVNDDNSGVSATKFVRPEIGRPENVHNHVGDKSKKCAQTRSMPPIMKLFQVYLLIVDNNANKLNAKNSVYNISLPLYHTL